jgi:hypothetical protein
VRVADRVLRPRPITSPTATDAAATANMRMRGEARSVGTCAHPWTSLDR